MREIQRKIIIGTLKDRLDEIKDEKDSINETYIAEYIFYSEIINNIDNFNEKSQYWNLVEIYNDGTIDEGPYENPISCINSICVISNIYSLYKYFINSFKNENINSLYIEGITFNFQKYRERIEKWNKKFITCEKFYRAINKFFYIISY